MHAGNRLYELRFRLADRDEAPGEAGCLGDGGERAAGGRPGDALPSGETVFEAGGGVGGGRAVSTSRTLWMPSRLRLA
jgi:hypothetical protein